MSNGSSVLELDAQVDALVGALVVHRAVVLDLEQQIVAGTARPDADDELATHREIAAEYTEEIRLLRSEIALIPEQRRAT